MMSSDWEVVRLGDVCEIKYGKDHKKLNNGCIPVYGTGGIMRYADEFLYDDESVLIPRKGSLDNIYYVNEKFWTVDTLFWTKINKLLIMPKFFYYYLKTINFSGMNVGSAVPSLTTKLLNEIEINLPPLETQEKIANILSSLDEKIENNKKTAEKLEEIAQTLFNRWFVEFNFPDENGLPYKDNGGEMVESELGLVPKGSRSIPITEMAEFVNGLALKKYPSMEGEKPLKVLKIKELRQGFCDDSSDLATSSVDSKYIINENDLIFSWSGSLLISFWNGERCFLNQHLFNVLPKNNFSKEFVYLVLNYFIDRFIHIAESKQTTMGHIKRRDLENAILPICSNDIVLNFEKNIKPIIQKQNELTIENKKLAVIRNNLITQLMNGELNLD